MMKRGCFCVLAAVLGLPACGGSGSDTVPAATETLHASSEGFVRISEAIELYYRITGDGGDTIVVVHGGPGLDLGYLLPDLEPLTASYTLIAYDQRGAGRSTLVEDSTAIHLAAHVADLEAVRQHFGLDRPILLGHSWGGIVVARYAMAYPQHVVKLVLANPAPPRRSPYMQNLGPRVERWMDSTTLAVLPELRAARVDATGDVRSACRAYWAVYARGYFADPFDTATISSMRGDFCTSSGAALLNGRMVNRVTMRSLGEWDWRGDLHQVAVPVLLLTGTGDTMPLESMREWEQSLPHAELVVLEGTGHYPHVERPAEYFRVVTDFLNR